MNALPAPSLVDIIAAAVVALAAVRGLLRGLSRELACVVSLVSAFVAGLLVYHPAGAWLQAHTSLGERGAHAAAFGGIVFGGCAALLVLGRLLGRVFRVVAEPPAERWGGLLAGLCSGLLLVAAAFVVLNLVPVEDLNRRFGADTLGGRLVQRAVPHLRAVLQAPAAAVGDSGQGRD